jgi:hypothetical protein
VALIVDADALGGRGRAAARRVRAILEQEREALVTSLAVAEADYLILDRLGRRRARLPTSSVAPISSSA